MPKAVVGLSSNINARVNIDKAGLLLADQFTLLDKSDFVDTLATDGSGVNYLNGAVLLETTLDQEQLTYYLKKFERVLGRDPESPHVVIDLDVLVFNGQVVRDEVFRHDFILNAVRQLTPEVL